MIRPKSNQDFLPNCDSFFLTILSHKFSMRNRTEIELTKSKLPELTKTGTKLHVIFTFFPRRNKSEILLSNRLGVIQRKNGKSSSISLIRFLYAISSRPSQWPYFTVFRLIVQKTDQFSRIFENWGGKFAPENGSWRLLSLDMTSSCIFFSSSDKGVVAFLILASNSCV